MTFNHKPVDGLGTHPVRIIGLGQAARDFLQSFWRGAPEPLVPLVADHLSWVHAHGHLRGVDFDGLAFIFIVIGDDATNQEIGDAVVLAWRANCHAVSTIGVFLLQDTSAEAYLLPPGGPPYDTSMLRFLRGMVDASIDVSRSCPEPTVDALRWVITTLRGLAKEGLLIFEPHWDLEDVQETLNLPGARLTLVSHRVEEGLGTADAVAGALDELMADGTALETASGMLVVLWQSETRRLSGHERRQASRMAREALGAGGMTLVLMANASRNWPGHGACATLVVGHPTSYPPLDGPT